jgi:rhodanese-related sulfurtransferase
MVYINNTIGLLYTEYIKGVLVNKVFIGVAVGIVVVVGVVGLGIASSGQSSNDTRKTEAVLTMTTIEADMQAGAVLLDVRTADEFGAGHIVGAKNLPLADIQGKTYPNASKNSKIYIYCRSGNRSAQAKTLLEGAGYTKVIDLGGMNEVVALGGKQS